MRCEEGKYFCAFARFIAVMLNLSLKTRREKNNRRFLMSNVEEEDLELSCTIQD